MKIIMIVLASVLVFSQATLSQPSMNNQNKRKSIKKEERPSARQLDLLERMQFDMTHPYVTEAKQYALLEAYNGYEDFFGAGRRIADGLTEERNLIDLVHAAKKSGGSVFMNVVFRSLDQDEKDYFLNLSDAKLEAAAKKYARWTIQAEEQWQSEPKY